MCNDETYHDLDFVALTEHNDMEVRFIEYMPFGGNKWENEKMVPYFEMIDLIKKKYPTLQRRQDLPNETSKTYSVPGFKVRRATRACLNTERLRG